MVILELICELEKVDLFKTWSLRFFLLSGYLMATLYPFDKNVGKSIIDFYYRRIKRILPIYVFVILITMSLLAKFVFPEEFDVVLVYAQWALRLAKNYQNFIQKRNYFDVVSFSSMRPCNLDCMGQASTQTENSGGGVHKGG